MVANAGEGLEEALISWRGGMKLGMDVNAQKHGHTAELRSLSRPSYDMFQKLNSYVCHRNATPFPASTSVSSGTKYSLDDGPWYFLNSFYPNPTYSNHIHSKPPSHLITNLAKLEFLSF
jgi:hypothetical protein